MKEQFSISTAFFVYHLSLYPLTENLMKQRNTLALIVFKPGKSQIKLDVSCLKQIFSPEIFITFHP